jgi:hypothetical protein
MKWWFWVIPKNVEEYIIDFCDCSHQSSVINSVLTTNTEQFQFQSFWPPEPRIRPDSDQNLQHSHNVDAAGVAICPVITEDLSVWDHQGDNMFFDGSSLRHAFACWCWASRLTKQPISGKLTLS